jgi:hypothetical protein
MNRALLTVPFPGGNDQQPHERVHARRHGQSLATRGAMDKQRLRDVLGAAVTDAPTPLEAADRLCAACVDMFDVDGASISFINGAKMHGTFGSSGPLSRTLDELQFTYGEGPCLEAVAQRQPVLAPDLDDPGERRWPALTQALLGEGVKAIFALPVSVASTPVGALDLFRRSSGPLDGDAMTGGAWAAGLAALPLLDLMVSDADWQRASRGQGSWDQLASLERVEVYQATGMIVAALGVTAADALIRLRAHAIARSLTASEVAHQILDRSLALDTDDWHDVTGDGTAR